MQIDSETMIRVRLAGRFDIRDRHGACLLPKAKKARGVLAYLALRDGARTERATLVDLLWSDRAAPQGKASLRQALRDIRDHLGPYGPQLLETERGTVRLRPDHLCVDLFAKKAALPDPNLPDPSLTDPLLDGLDPLDPVFDDWLAQTRRQILQAQLTHAETAMAAVDPLRDADGALEAARQVLRLDPVSETATRLAMRIHGARQELSHARRYYEDLRRTLAEDGFSPSPRTEDLYAQLQDLPRVPPAPMPPAHPGTAPHTGRTMPAIAVPPMRIATGDTGDAGNCPVCESVESLLFLRLAQIHEARVLAPGTDAQGAAYRLVTSLGLRADKAVFTAHLVDVAQGDTIWAGRDNFAHDLDEARLCARIDKHLAEMLPAIEQRETATLPDPCQSAYEHYLAARRAFYRASQLDYVADVVGHLEQAIALDPEFLPAYDMLILSLNTGNFMTRPGVELTEARARALDLTQRVLALNSKRANAHLAMAWCQMWKANFDAAERSVEQAMGLAPYEPSRLNAIGTILIYLGRQEEGERYYHMAQDRMVRDLDYQRSDFGELYYLKREFETALSWLDPGEQRARYRTLFWRIATHAQLGQLSAAQADLDALEADIAQRWHGTTPFTLDDGVRWYVDLIPLRRAEDRDVLLDGLAKAGLRF